VARALLAAGRLGEAAPHFARSAEVGDSEAVEALRHALGEAERRGAYREALTILGSLVDLLPHGDKRWLEVADAMSFQAEWVVDHRADTHALLGIRALRAIDAALEGSPNFARRAAVKLRLGTFLSWGTGDLDEAEQACRDAAELFEAGGDRSQALLSRLELVFLTGLKGDLQAWVQGGTLVAEAAEAAGDRAATMHAVGRAVGFGAFVIGRHDEAQVAFRRGLAMAREDSKPYFQTLTLTGISSTLAMAGRIEEALSAMEEAKAVNPDWRDSLLLEWQSLIHWLAGDFPAAVAAAEESALWNPQGLSKRRGIGTIFAVLAAIETGQSQEAHRHLGRAETAYERDWLFYRHYCDYVGRVLDWREGRRAEAIERLRRAALRTLGMGAMSFSAFPYLDLAEIAAGLDRADLTREAAGQLRDIAAALDVPLYRGLAALGAAWAGLVSGNPGRAIEPARSAVQLLASTGCRAFHGRALDALGRSLSASDRPSAVSAFDEAATIFESCGGVWRRDRALESMRQLGSRGRRAAAAVTGPASLTRRERQVARLAAQGHTVRQIAEQLYISERTVETHLSAVYGKLGVSSKSELVGRAFGLEE
jgi:DNA-binding CsgD family transcriptional regulator